MKRDYVITFLTEFFVLFCAIMVYRLAVLRLGPIGFSEYTLARRVISFLQPALLVGMQAGLPRYIALSRGKNDEISADNYFLSGLGIIILVFFLFTVITNLCSHYLAFLFFGNNLYTYLIQPVNLMIFGLVLHVSAYSYYRGRLMMGTANILQLVNLGIVPVLSFILFAKDIFQVLVMTGLIWSLVSLFFLIRIIFRIEAKLDRISSQTKEIFIYGIQRLPGDFGINLLLSLPAIITVHIGGIEVAGYMAFAVSVLNMVGSIFAPIGLILLPSASKMLMENKISLLKSHAIKIIKVSLGITITGLAIFEVFAPQIINLYLGLNYPDLIMIARIVLLGSLGYVVYMVMRGIIDAYYDKALNTKNIFISVFMFLFLAAPILLTRQYTYITISFVLAMCILGGFTLYDVKKIFRDVMEHKK